MMLNPGTRFGPYEIVSLLGAGGMGEVYRARDARLNRDVAWKVLPAAFAQDPDRIVRFAREAQALAALNHPQIAAIFGVEDQHGRHGLVMELVEAHTLSDRLAAGRSNGATRCPLHNRSPKRCPRHTSVASSIAI